MADPRFEVPPEYADVYERAFRAAYEERHGAEPDDPPRRTDVRIPGQRRTSVPDDLDPEDRRQPGSSFRSATLRGTHDALVARDAEARAEVTVRTRVPPEPDDGFGGRHRQRSSVLPLMFVAVGAFVALAAAFGLGWLTSSLG